MKAAPFEYYRPMSLAEGLNRLEQSGEDGRILAGGQSLAPVLALRLARPKVLIDINRLPELDYIQEQHGWLAIGALTRQRALEQSSEVAKWCPLLWESMPLIGHIQTRNRGTIGGSVAHSDPAAELPAIALALDAAIVIASSKEKRSVAAKDFFVSAYSTALQYNEMLTEIRFPPWPAGAGWAVLELSPHHGSFAIAGTAVCLQIASSGAARDVRIALFGVDHVPRRAELAEKRLEGERIHENAISDAAAQATAEIESYEDVQASGAYRRHVGSVLVKRALMQAVTRAASGEAAHV